VNSVARYYGATAKRISVLIQTTFLNALLNDALNTTVMRNRAGANIQIVSGEAVISVRTDPTQWTMGAPWIRAVRMTMKSVCRSKSLPLLTHALLTISGLGNVLGGLEYALPRPMRYVAAMARLHTKTHVKV